MQGIGAIADKRQLVQDRIYEELKKEILSRDRTLGYFLTEKDLAVRYGASRTPARAALNRLESEGLLKRQGHTLVVTRLNPDDVKDIMHIRMSLDGLAASLAVERMTDGEMNELEEICAKMGANISAHQYAEAARYDRLFHEAIAAGSRNDELRSILQKHYDRLHVFRLYSYSIAGVPEKSLAEHAAVCSYIRDRNGSKAEEAARAHVAWVLATIVDHLRDHPIQW